MKCPKCNQEINIEEIKNKLSDEISKINWQELILDSANISTVGAEDISNAHLIDEVLTSTPISKE